MRVPKDWVCQECESPRTGFVRNASPQGLGLSGMRVPKDWVSQECESPRTGFVRNVSPQGLGLWEMWVPKDWVCQESEVSPQGLGVHKWCDTSPRWVTYSYLCWCLWSVFSRTQQQLKDETLNNYRNKLILVSIVTEQFQWPCYILMVVIGNLETITTVAFSHCEYLSVHCWCFNEAFDSLWPLAISSGNSALSYSHLAFHFRKACGRSAQTHAPRPWHRSPPTRCVCCCAMHWIACDSRG